VAEVNNKPEIIAWMKPSCGWSNGVRAVMSKYGLEYDDRDIINVAENFYEMVTKTGQRLQPSLQINGELLADVSGDEVEAFLIERKIVMPSSDPTSVPTDSSCTDEEHEAMAREALANSTGIQLGDISS
tara:strand:+ start:361 stop:747 length:387 start_codon:yes stop_codon:yes gene_type:complete